SGDEPPPAVHLRARGLCGQRLPHGVRARLRRRGQERRALRRQDPQRREAVGDSRRAADQVRARDQFKSREADRPHDSAERAGKSGPGDQVRLFFLIGALMFAVTATAQAQTRNAAKVGVLSPFTPAGADAWHHAFRQGLRDLGWIEEKNISLEYRFAEGKNDRLPALAADLVRLKVDVIVTAVNTDTLAARNATKTIPIVMASAGDPVGFGLVDSLAHPGGNVTGLSQIAPELSGKRLELLKEIVPNLSRVAALWNPKGTTSPLS